MRKLLLLLLLLLLPLLLAPGLLSGLGPWFAGTMLKVPGSEVVGVMMRHMEPHFAASMFGTTGKTRRCQ